jgi:autotransporter-associated beta strand protein
MKTNQHQIDPTRLMKKTTKIRPVKLSAHGLVLALAGLLLGCLLSAQAATDTWSGTANGTWNTANLNWNGGTTGFTSGDDALFSGTPANNVTTATGLTIGAITLDGTFTGSVALTGANTVNGATTISAGTLSLVNATALGTSAATINSAGTLWLKSPSAGLTYANNMSGAGTLKVTPGTDTLQMSGDLSGFTGLVDLYAGTTYGKLAFNTTQAKTLSASATVKVENGSTLYLNQALTYNAAVQLYGMTTVEAYGALRLEAGANQAGSVTLFGNSSIGVAGTAAAISGNIGESGGSYGFTKLQSLTLTNSGVNTYSGKTIITAGTLSVSSINNAGSAGNLGQNSTVDINNATLQYTGAGETSDRVINLSGTTGGATINNLGAGLLKFTSNLTATNGGNKTLTLGGTTGTGELAGKITNGPTGETALTKTGANTWTLSAATNTFTGQLQVNAGTLVWNTAGALAPAAGSYLPLNIVSGGALIVNGPLRYSGSSQSVSGYLNVGNNAAGGIGTITINSGGSLTFANQSGNPNSIVGQQGTGGTSQLTVNGGSFNWDSTGGLIVGNGNGSGLLLITNGGTATILKGTGNTEEGYIALGRNSLTSTGTVYLANGTLATDRVIATGVATPIGVGYVYFDGGTLKALGNQSDWLQAAVSGAMNPPNAVTIAAGGAKIDANGFSVAINNNLLHGGVSATDGGLTKLGLGTLTLGGFSHTFTGPTVVSNGILSVTGSLPSGSAVTVAGGKLTVAGSVGGAVSVQPGGAIGVSSGTFSSLVTLHPGNSAINLQDGSASTTYFNNGLTLNNGNVLAFDLGSSSDQIYVSGGTYTHNGTTTINLAAISGISATYYPLIFDAAYDITSTNGYVLGTVPGGYTATLDASGGYLAVTLKQSAPGVAYWKGDVDKKWNTLTGGINSNWATDSTGATDTGAPPGTPTAVTFAATGAANFNTVLGADFTINNLTLSTANSVTIGGATNSLTIIAGLLNDTTALNNTLSVSNVVLGSSQTWQNNSANPLTVSSLIGGASALTIGGSGSIVLTSTNNSYSGGTFISGGTLQLGDGTAGNGAVAGNITNYSVLEFANPAAQTFSGNLDGYGTVTKSAAGTLTFPADNTYYGNTTISNGSLAIVTANGAGSGTIDVKSGAALVCQPATTTTYANTVTGTGLVKILFGNEGLGYNGGGSWDTHLDNLSGFNGTIQLSATTATNVNKWTTTSASVSGTSALIIDSGAQLYMNGNSLTFTTIQVNGSGNYENRGAVRAGAGTFTGAISLLGDTTFGTEGGTIAGTLASGAAGTQILTLGGASDLTGDITVSADIGGGTGTIALNKINSGTTTLSGNNTFAGPTTNSAGTLTLANGSALQNSTLNITGGTLQFDGGVSSNAFVFGGLAGTINIALANSYSASIALTVGNNNSNSTYSGVLGDSALGSSLTKVGNGTLTLSGANTYSGTTTVSGGKLVINTLQTNATTGIAVNDGTTLTLNVSGTNQLAPAAYALGSSTGATNEFVGLGSTTIAPVNAGTLTLAGQTTVNITGGSFVVGNTYPVISYTSISGTGGFKLGALPRGMSGNIVTNGGNTIALSVTSFAPVKNVWTGSVNTNWDIAITANWQTNGGADVYFDGDVARFDDTATATNVFVTTAVSPGSMIVSNVSKTFTFTGSSIGGAGSLTKQGAGTLVLNQANTYNGNTVISNGTVQLGVANAIPGGAGKGEVTVGGALDLNANSAVLNGLSGSGTVDTVAGGTPTLTLGSSGSTATFNGAIQNTAGTLTVVKSGPGTQTLGGNNTYSGATTVSGGTLKLANANALGTTAGGTTVATNATLDLNGQAIGGEVLTLQSGATLQNSSGSAASVTGNINAAGGATYAITGTGDIVLNTFALTSGSGQFDVTNYNTGTIDLAGTVDNGYMNLHVAAGTVLLDKVGAGQRATSALFVEGGTAKLGNTNGDQIFDGNALTIESGTFDLNGMTETVGNLVGSGGVILNSSNATTATLTIGGDDAAGDVFYGNLQDGAGRVALTKTGTGAAQSLQGFNTYSGPTTISAGALTLIGNSGISNSVLVNVLGTLNIARYDGTLFLTSGQTLTGTGTIGGWVSAQAGSVITPGGTNTVGTLTVSGNLTLAGKLLMKLDRTNSPSNCDQLTVYGTTTYGGTLLVTNLGEVLQARDTFQLFPTATSGFAGINLATTDAHGQIYAWTNKLAVDGSIQVLSVGSPVNTNPTNVTAAVSGNGLTLSWPADHLGWHLQVQTNSLATGLGTNWVTLPGSDAVITTNLTINPANGAVFYRLVYP